MKPTKQDPQIKNVQAPSLLQKMLLCCGIVSSLIYVPTVVCAAMMWIGALTGFDSPRLAQNLPTPWMGIGERVNIFAYMLWIAVLSIILLQSENQIKSDNLKDV